MANYNIGKIVKGTVTGIEKYGFFVLLDEYYSGLVHISEISNNYVRDINDFVKVGDVINTKILEIDEKNNQIKLSIKDLTFKDKSNYKRRKIIETEHGFSTLKSKLPLWIEKSLKKFKKEIK